MLSEQIKKLREKHGLSQNKLAKRAGVPQCTISKLEAGKKEIYYATAVKILRALGYDLVIGVLNEQEGGEKFSS